jgi:hypothetical protein
MSYLVRYTACFFNLSQYSFSVPTQVTIHILLANEGKNEGFLKGENGSGCPRSIFEV